MIQIRDIVFFYFINFLRAFHSKRSSYTSQYIQISIGPRGQKIMRSTNNVGNAGPHVCQTFLNDQCVYFFNGSRKRRSHCKYRNKFGQFGIRNRIESRPIKCQILVTPFTSVSKYWQNKHGEWLCMCLCIFRKQIHLYSHITNL
jgi:hypothetical protein